MHEFDSEKVNYQKLLEDNVRQREALAEAARIENLPDNPEETPFGYCAMRLFSTGLVFGAGYQIAEQNYPIAFSLGFMAIMLIGADCVFYIRHKWHVESVANNSLGSLSMANEREKLLIMQHLERNRKNKTD